MEEACCYRSFKNNIVNCRLCTHYCFLKEGERGFCKVRINVKGKLYNTIYEKLSSFSTDYIEKTPLYHFYPNHRFITVGSFGCNLKCAFCLTWSITQVEPEEFRAEYIKADKIVEASKQLKCRGVVYTHSEPTLNIEYYAKIMELAKGNGLLNVFATNGLISPEGLKTICEYIDAVALTVKGNQEFYSKVCGFKFNNTHLLRLIDIFKSKNTHLELVYVIIPGFNDDEKNLSEAIHLSKKADSPLILLRFFPSYKMDKIDSPSEKIMEKALNLAYSKGLKYVYLENIFSHPGKNTYCEKCKKLLIRREGYGIVEWHLEGNKCPRCGTIIPIRGYPYFDS
jgi:pyruvate formate lyase activating enzyme